MDGSLGALFALLVLVAVGVLGWWLVRQQQQVTRTALGEVRDELTRQQQAELLALGDRHRAELDRAVLALRRTAADELGDHHRQGERALQTRKQLIDAELARVAVTLEQLTSLVRQLEADRATQLGGVAEQLGAVTRAHAELAATTGALREALTSSQARGQWGERLAEDVLRAAGFVEGVSYRTQTTTAQGNRPDVTFLLPGEKVLHLDVKFPLANYLAMLEAEAEADREARLAAFLADVRGRVRELATRDYRDPEGSTLDLVLLFLPNEAVYGFVHEQDPTLLDDALARKVVLCSPSTLFAVLAVIRQAVDAFAVERASDEMLTLLGGLGDQWRRVVEVLERLGRGLDQTTRAYEELTGPRRRQLERRLADVDRLRRERGLPAVSEDGDEDGAGPAEVSGTPPVP